MSAWRSILGRPQPIISRLRPSRLHASQLTTVLGSSNNLIGSRGFASDSNIDPHTEINRQHRATAAVAAEKRHLYVVLDDHKDGFGVHKLDVGEDDDDHKDGAARRLPRPPVLRVALPTVVEGAQFAAVGSSIVGIGKHLRSSVHSDTRSILIYDTKTAVTSFSSQLPEGLRHGYTAAMAAGNRLYMLEYGSNPCPGGGGEDDDPFYDGDLHCLTMDPGGRESRDWKLLSPCSRWYWRNINRGLTLPFRQTWPGYISALAVHAPPGAAHHDIYVSASTTGTHHGFTFSFSTASGKWTRRGEWLLPVVGHTHYDNKLDAWLGLHSINGDTETRWRESRRGLCTDGHLCAGHVASAPSEWKVGREKFFHFGEDIAAGWRHVDAKLVPMEAGNGGSDYCLMERLRPDGVDEEEWLGDGDKCMLRLTYFLVERGKDGEPVVTSRRPASTYKVSRYNRYFDAQAFWM